MQPHPECAVGTTSFPTRTIKYSATVYAVWVLVCAGWAEVSSWPGLGEGVYLVGTGSSGVAETFMTLSAGYFTAMMIGGLGMRVPKDGWQPQGYVPPR